MLIQKSKILENKPPYLEKFIWKLFYFFNIDLERFKFSLLKNFNFSCKLENFCKIFGKLFWIKSGRPRRPECPHLKVSTSHISLVLKFDYGKNKGIFIIKLTSSIWRLLYFLYQSVSCCNIYYLILYNVTQSYIINIISHNSRFLFIDNIIMNVIQQLIAQYLL